MNNRSTPSKKTAQSATSTGNAEYDKIKADLKTRVEEKAKLEQELEKINQLIFDKETEYYGRATGSMNQYGNIIKGFDSFLKTHTSSSSNTSSAYGGYGNSGTGRSSSHGPVKNSDNTDLPDSDRIFSLSNSLYEVKEE